MTVNKILIFFLVFALSSHTWAADRQLHPLSLKQLANATNNWSFECDPSTGRASHKSGATKAQLSAALKNLVTDAVEIGFLRLEKINPLFARELVKSLGQKSRRIYCDYYDHGSSPGETTSFFAGSGFKVQHWIVEDEYLARNALNNNQEMPLGYRVKPEEILDSNRAIVFHETLHLAGADNLPKRLHNEGRRDVVFSCADLVFIKNLKTFKVDCEVCGKAFKVGKKAKVNFSLPSEPIESTCLQFDYSP